MLIKCSDWRIAKIKPQDNRFTSKNLGMAIIPAILQRLNIGKLVTAGIVSTTTAWYLTDSSPLRAQITSDGTLDTEVNTANDVTEITGGSKAGSNLFHSFDDFSVATDSTAFFNNASNISNIISRVTGGNLSNIDGLIKANGSANLILLNPSGISFGANARLDIGGSFLGTTAESLLFEDGTVFSATDTQTTPILTISVPVGLQLGQKSENITVSGTGHNLSVSDPVFSAIALGEESGLKVNSGQTLALVGGEVILDGGTISAPGGKIELGSVAEGIVNISLTDSNLNLGYENIAAFDNIQLRSQALADASGTKSISAGSIQVNGRQLALNDGSLLLVQNQSEETAGTIDIDTSESVTVSGTNNDGTIRSSITNETLGLGRGGDIKISTSQLTVDGGATIVAKTLPPGIATGGDLEIDASELVQVIGASSINPSVTSSIVAASFGEGDGGNNTITTDFLNAIAGGTIAATVFNTGNGGDLNITANAIELEGIEPNVFAPSALTASTLGAGNAGSLTVDTSSLKISQGARVDASTAAAGNAGNVAISASDSITIDGTVPESVNPSLIVSAANILDPTLQEVLRLPSVPSGNSGNITIATPKLDITAGGQLTVRNDGSGDAGNLLVEADTISLSDGGGITASTQAGKVGNINLQVQDSLSLSRNSQISSDNFGKLTGGAISINTDLLNISDRSFITTTTFGAGNGGNIDILAQDINITGTGFTQFQENFQIAALDGTLQPETRGTGIFIGTVDNGTAGTLNIDTNSLSLSQGAVIFSPVFTAGTGGQLNINAAEFNLDASALQAGAGPASVSSGSSGDINIETENLEVSNGGTIINLTLGDAAGGNIKIEAAESVKISDTPPDAFLLTGIYTNTSLGLGTGGDIDLNTQNLQIADAVIASNTGALFPDGTIIPVGGKGGNINIQAADSVEVGGIPMGLAFTRGIGTTTYSDSDAGDLTVATGKLVISDGADFSVATIGSGDGGQLTIDATDSVELIGTKNVGGINQGGLLATSGRRELSNIVSTGKAGNISLTAPELTVSNGASIDVQSLGVGDAGNLAITADSILLADQGNLSAATQVGMGGDIEVNTNTLKIDRGLINASVLGKGTGGNIEIIARDSVEIIGSGFDNLQENFFNLRFLSPETLANLDPDGLIQGILAATIDEGMAGTIDIQTDNLQLNNGSLIATATVINGTAGSIALDIAETLQVDDSVITASTIFSGQGGDINIDTGELEVLAGGQIIASTLGSGDGGNLTINAADSVTIKGKGTRLNDTVNFDTELEISPDSINSAGIVTQLNINNNSAISVASSGTGDAGTLQINADSIFLDQQGTISAATQSGTGGNIFIDVDNVIWRGQSTTTATSTEAGDGGNIFINANNLVALESSQLAAEANEGMGGNINIETQGLFVCQECQISASSQLGVDGVVEIETIRPVTQLEAVDLPQQLTQPQEAVAIACKADSQANSSELTITGRGGLPPRPQEPLSSQSLITFGNYATTQPKRSPEATENTSQLPPAAHSWYLNDRGTVVLATQTTTIPNNVTATNPDCHVR